MTKEQFEVLKKYIREMIDYEMTHHEEMKHSGYGRYSDDLTKAEEKMKKLFNVEE